MPSSKPVVWGVSCASKEGGWWDGPTPDSGAWQPHAHLPLQCAVNWFSHAQHCATPGTEACPAPLSMGSSRQEFLSGLPRPHPDHPPGLGIEPTSPVSPALTDPSPLYHLRSRVVTADLHQNLIANRRVNLMNQWEEKESAQGLHGQTRTLPHIGRKRPKSPPLLPAAGSCTMCGDPDAEGGRDTVVPVSPWRNQRSPQGSDHW